MQSIPHLRPLPSCSALPRIALSVLLLLAFPCAQTGNAQPSREHYRETVLEIQQHIEQNDLDGARALIASATKKFPADGGLDNLLGVIEIQQGNTDRAMKAFTAAIQHDPKLTGAYLNLGRIYMQTAATDKNARTSAIQAYEKLLRLDPANPEADYLLATALLWDQNYQRSLDHLARLDKEARSQIGAEDILCADEAALGHTLAATKAADLLIANPDLAEQDAMEVLPSLRSAHHADLIESIFAAVNARHPLSTSGLRILGLAQEANGKLPQARTTLEQVFAQDSSSVVVLVDLTRIANASKDYQGALGYLAHARELDPKDPSLPYEFGVICLKLSLLGESRKALGEAVKLAPENPEYNFGMGTVSSFAQDPTEGLPYLEKYHALRPSDPAVLLSIGSTYFRAKNFDAAKTWLNQAAEHTPTAADAHYYLGRIARQQGHLDDAARELNQSNALVPNRPDILAELGQVFIGIRNYKEAETYLDHAIQLDKDNYAANFGLLQLYARTGDTRREEQSKRFDEVKDKNEEQYKEMMRIIEVRPEQKPGS